MSFYYYFIYLVLVLINCTQCDVNLQIVKNVDDYLTPVNMNVEERVGTTFSLICELVSPSLNKEIFDENLSWFKGEKPINQSRNSTIYSHTEINKSEKKFNSLQLSDNGEYYCVSFKFDIFKSVKVMVRDNDQQNEMRLMTEQLMRETSFCNEQMFKCISNGVCIIQHYVCDGKPDCKDGSDESIEKCNGEPCKDKIPCDDGRCIPTAWCCDRHHDLNCTVTNRPKCCQILSETYEELEYGFPNVSQTSQNGARYLFISICIVSIVFSIVLLLLILSKVVIFAKKTALQQQSNNLCEAIALRNQTHLNLLQANVLYYAPPVSPTRQEQCVNSNFSSFFVESSDVSDPLIFPPRFNIQNDQPPSYIDVLRNNRAASEPPPPYTSREALN